MDYLKTGLPDRFKNVVTESTDLENTILSNLDRQIIEIAKEINYSREELSFFYYVENVKRNILELKAGNQRSIINYITEQTVPLFAIAKDQEVTKSLFQNDVIKTRLPQAEIDRRINILSNALLSIYPKVIIEKEYNFCDFTIHDYDERTIESFLGYAKFIESQNFSQIRKAILIFVLIDQGVIKEGIPLKPVLASIYGNRNINKVYEHLRDYEEGCSFIDDIKKDITHSKYKIYIEIEKGVLSHFSHK